VLNQIEPKSEWPVSLLLETAATTGRLSEIFAQFTAGTLDLPIGEQILEVAATLSRDHPDLSMQLREYEYQREVQAGNASASSYLGLADVRIKQRRTDDALALLRDLTLSVGAPFENLAPAVALLEKNGLKQNAANYAREWKTAEPWNPEAVLALGRLTADKALLESVRKSASAEYTLRAASAGNLRDLKSADAGTTELDLLTHESISQQEAEQPFFVLARLRAAEGSADSGVQTKLYAEAIALKPSLHEQRLALAQAAFQNKQEALGLAAWHSFNGPPNIPWLHSSSLKAALDVQPDRMLKVEELMADVLTKRLQYAEAETIYARMLQQSKDAPLLARIGKLKDTVAAAVKLDRFNRSRAPIISNELSQARIVKPMLKGVPLQ
jgi:hypothetical protein